MHSEEEDDQSIPFLFFVLLLCLNCYICFHACGADMLFKNSVVASDLGYLRPVFFLLLDMTGPMHENRRQTWNSAVLQLLCSRISQVFGNSSFHKTLSCSLVLIFGDNFFQGLQTWLSSSIRTNFLRHSSIRKPLILNCCFLGMLYCTWYIQKWSKGTACLLL